MKHRLLFLSELGVLLMFMFTLPQQNAHTSLMFNHMGRVQGGGGQPPPLHPVVNNSLIVGLQVLQHSPVKRETVSG